MDGKDRIIAEQRELIAKLTAQLEQLTARIAELELALAKAKKNSSTSSKPPSSDIVKPKPKQKRPGRRIGWNSRRHLPVDYFGNSWGGQKTLDKSNCFFLEQTKSALGNYLRHGSESPERL